MTEATPEPEAPRAGRLVGLALVSAAVLLLQLVQTRVFSVMLWHHLTYLVVTFTLLGFAAGGAVLACRPKWLGGDVSARLAGCALTFAALIVIAYVVVTRQVDGANGVAGAAHSGGGIATAALDYALLVVPMVFGGMAVALALSGARGAMGRTYAVNMGGSALGCVLYVPVLRVLGGEGTVLASAALAAFAAWCFAADARRRASWRGATAAATLGLLALALFAPRAMFEVPVASSKAMMEALAVQPDATIETTRWDPLCRIDVIGPADGDPSVQRMVYQDGDAPTALPPAAALHTDVVGVAAKEGLGYLLFQDRVPRVLAIGIGGGIDILQSAHHARRVAEVPPDFTGIEINRTTAGLMRGPYREFSGDRYALPGVTIHDDEGRSWLRRSDELYDIIQMTGTDTYAALSSGSYVMSESYLYTAEAYDDFIAHLTDDGVISVLRFLFDPPRETLRLAAIAVDALRRAGVAEPDRHVVVLSFRGPRRVVDGQEIGLDYGALLFKRTPFTSEQVTLYQRYARAIDRVEVLWAPEGEVADGPVADYFGAVRSGEDDAFRASYVYNLDPVTDDEPFFFRYHRWSSLWGGGPAEPGAGSEYADIVGGQPIGLIMLGTMLGESALLVAALVIVPLLLFRRTGLAVPGAGRWVLYFFGLGAGYILVEIVAMQRFVLFLGHPGYAITVVLVTFLVFSGLGSAWAGTRADRARTARRALVVVLVLIAALAVGLPAFFDAALKLALGWRIALTVVVLAPAAFAMGMPFPSGLSLASERAQPLVPWAFGVNGGASVIASVAGILIAMGGGFSAAFGAAGLAYGLALIAALGPRAFGATAEPMRATPEEVRATEVTA